MDFSIKKVGDCTVPSPLLDKYGANVSAFVDDNDRVVYRPMIQDGNIAEVDLSESFEQAGPRKAIHFKPDRVRSAIATCGGLCPGINSVIRSIVMESYYRYGSTSITGIRYGYSGLDPANGYKPVELDPDRVEDIHLDGGTILGSSRGGTEDMEVLVDTLESMKINILYTVGGDGTLRGAHKINEIARTRGLDLAVISIPKTIDNDISFIQRSFGFETAFSLAVESIYTAHIESKGSPNGIGLVKLMGRYFGLHCLPRLPGDERRQFHPGAGSPLRPRRRERLPGPPQGEDPGPRPRGHLRRGGGRAGPHGKGHGQAEARQVGEPRPGRHRHPF